MADRLGDAGEFLVLLSKNCPVRTFYYQLDVRLDFWRSISEEP